MGILVVLGHENREDGQLSPTAVARCDRAIEILKAEPDLKVLPTGAFGQFNQTATAHGEYLSRHLVQNGIPRERILPFTNSSNTIEDALCARRIVIDLGEDRVLVVTSDFHMPRTRFVFERTFPGWNIEFHAAPDRLSSAQRADKVAEEASKLVHTRREWVDVPLYGTSAGFPNQIYDNAHAEHKHYDNVSLAIVTGMIAVFLFPYTAMGTDFRSAVMLLFSSGIIFCLTLMYELAAQTARTARRVLHNIEMGFGCHGFSALYPRQEFASRNYLKIPVQVLRRRFPSLTLLNPDPGIRDIVILLASVMIVVQIITAVVLAIVAVGRLGA